MQEVFALDVEVLQALLKTHVIGIGDRLVYVPEVESTNTLAMHLGQERPVEGE